jgi:hypothetical protein
MTPVSRRQRRPLIAVAGSLAVATSLVLSGCSLLHLPGVPGGSSTSGGISIPGLGSAGTGKLPKDFPSEIPVAKGDIVTGVSLGVGAERVWNVSVKVSGVDAFTSIESDLKGAGFSEPDGANVQDASGVTAAFQGSKYDVAVVIVKADDKTGWVADYTVTPASKSNG